MGTHTLGIRGAGFTIGAGVLELFEAWPVTRAQNLGGARGDRTQNVTRKLNDPEAPRPTPAPGTSSTRLSRCLRL